MPATAEHADTLSAIQLANEALREAGLARQALLAHERHCVERSRETAQSLERIGHDLRAFMAQSRDARARLHARVDGTEARLADNQATVMEAFDDLRRGMIRALSALLLSLAGAFGGVLWYLLTGLQP